MKVALIEIGGSHDECLYAQLLFLKANKHTVTLICSTDLSPQVKNFTEADEQLFFDFKDQGIVKRMQNILKIRSVLIKGKYDKVIFNTAQGNLVRSLLKLPFPKKLQFFGTIHDLKKLRGSFTQKQITKKVKKYFVLNDYLLGDVPENYPAQFAVYYPIFFPKFNSFFIEKSSNEIWIGIPGRAEFGRRDYRALFDCLSKNNIDKNIRFILLGKSDTSGENALEKEMTDLGISAYFKVWNSFITNEEFHSYLLKCDFIMPLIHPDITDYYTYFKHQVSGSYNLAFAYKIPLLCEEKFTAYEDFKENAIFYTIANIGKTLNELASKKVELSVRCYQNKKWSFEVQQKKYNTFIDE